MSSGLLLLDRVLAHHVLRFCAQMMLRQNGADEHAEHCASEHACEYDRADADGTHGRLLSRLIAESGVRGQNRQRR
jgi:hypothetical protein